MKSWRAFLTGACALFGLLGGDHAVADSNHQECETQLLGKNLEVDPALLLRLRSPGKEPDASLQESLAEALPLELLQEALSVKTPFFELGPKPEKGMRVYLFEGDESPQVLEEIGRLREKSFRQVGEGSGQALDLDRFDRHYSHLVAIDKSKGQIAGAYRIGRVDQILARQGADGLYMTELFSLGHLLNHDFARGAALEMGRSFIVPEYQKSLALYALWGAIGQFLVRHPHYRYLYGPVSVSGQYREGTRFLIQQYLIRHHERSGGYLVEPKKRPRYQNLNATGAAEIELVSRIQTVADLDAWIRLIEENPKAQTPTLVKYYLDLGAEVLNFHHDVDFNTLDAAIIIDIHASSPLNMIRYMGEEGARVYRQSNGLAPLEAP